MMEQSAFYLTIFYIMFYLLFILYQQSNNHKKKLIRHNFKIQLLVESFIWDNQQTRIRSGRKATDILKRFIKPRNTYETNKAT